MAAPAVEAGEPGSQSVPIKHTRPKVQKFDNGFIIEDTHMGPAQGKVGCPTLIALSKFDSNQAAWQSTFHSALEFWIRLLQAMESRLRQNV